MRLFLCSRQIMETNSNLKLCAIRKARDILVKDGRCRILSVQ